MAEERARIEITLDALHPWNNASTNESFYDPIIETHYLDEFSHWGPNEHIDTLRFVYDEPRRRVVHYPMHAVLKIVVIPFTKEEAEAREDG